MRFASKVAIVTGGARGIGFAIASRLGGEGAAIAIADLDERDAVERLGVDGICAIALLCDVANEKSMETAAQRAADELGTIDILVANAGLHLTYTKAPCELSGADWRRLMDVNVIGVINGARSCRDAMRDGGGAGKRTGGRRHPGMRRGAEARRFRGGNGALPVERRNSYVSAIHL